MFSIILIIFLSVIAYISYKSKLSKPLDFSFITLISLFVIFNRGNNDYDGYVKIFERPELYAEPGYVIIVNFIKFFGFGHEGILFLLGLLVALTFIRYTRYSKSMGLVLLCYFIFPFPSDIVQIRNTFSMFFLFNALLEYNNKKYFRGYVLLAIGASFHHLGFLYIIPFFLFFLQEKKYHFRIILLFGILSSILLPFVIDQIKLNSEEIRKVENYISEKNKIQSLATWGSIALFDIYIFNYFLKKLKSHDKNTLQLIKLLNVFLGSSIVFLPGLLYLDEFNRLFRTMFVVKYLLMGIMIPYLSQNNKLVLTFYVLCTSILFGLYYANQLDYDYILFTNLLILF